MGVSYDEDIVNLFRSERLLYRAVDDTSEADKKLFFELNNDPVNLAFAQLGMPKPAGPHSVTKFFERIKDSPLTVVACLPPPPAGGPEHAVPEPTPIGFVCLFNPHGGPISHHRSAMLGISLLTAHRGQGYGGEMINWCLDWGFRRAALHRIEIGAWSYNPNALKLYESLGFKEEGRAREALWFDRGWHDAVRMGMLEGEWEVLRGLKRKDA